LDVYVYYEIQMVKKGNGASSSNRKKFTTKHDGRMFFNQKAKPRKGKHILWSTKKKKKHVTVMRMNCQRKKKRKKEMLRIVNIEKNVQMDESMERSMMVMRNSIRIRV